LLTATAFYQQLLTAPSLSAVAESAFYQQLLTALILSAVAKCAVFISSC
jgi:hypothetical protein